MADDDSSEFQKTDPFLRYNLFKEAEGKLLDDLKEHEREIKRLLAELETIRNLLEEASDDIEESEQKRLQREHEKVEKQRRALEEVVSESAETRNEESSEEAEAFADNYTPITSQRLTRAASYSTRQELYQLQGKDSWTPDDAYRFFEISDAVKTSQQYSFSVPIQENVNRTYDLIKDVAKQRRTDIENNYDSSKVRFTPEYQTSDRTSKGSSSTPGIPSSSDMSKQYSSNLENRSDSSFLFKDSGASESSNNDLTSQKDNYKPNK